MWWSIHPLTMIMEIGMIHMAYLGDTLEKIAGEKAGIIKIRYTRCLYRQAEGDFCRI